ncbi:MAG: hypothetical protein IKU07_02440 [Oscillospiraceae bacterium]|nr:hypothetical protein [Oscillospiraceae bacterium]
MKKFMKFLLPMLVVALCVLLALGAAAETQLPEQCAHCGKAVTWSPLSQVTATTIPAGHYYVDAETVYVTNKSVAKNTSVCIYMNGNTVEAEGVDRVFYVSGNLTIMGEGTVKGYGRNSTLGTTDRYGGTVYILSSGTFNLYDATVTSEKITGSKASNGGNINVYGVFNMYSGTVSNGYASNAGGNIFVAPAGKFNMYGGTVSGGTCSAGASVCTQGKVMITGNAVINDLFVWDKSEAGFETLWTIKGVYTGSISAITLRKGTAKLTPAVDMVVAASENANVRKAKLTFGTSGLFAKVDGNKVVLTTEDPSVMQQVCKACGETVTWTMLSEANAEDASIAAGHYYLDFAEGTDIWSPKTISAKVCIDLGGMTLDTNTRAFEVQKNGVLSIQGNGTVIGHGRTAGGATADRVGGTILVSSGGTLNLYDGTLTFGKVDGQSASNGGVICCYGVFNMYGGCVKDGVASNAGANVFVTPAGSLNMYSGVISGGSGSSSVYCQGSLKLAGDAQLNKAYLTYKNGGPALTEMVTVQGAYIGNALLDFATLTAAEGAVIGISDNADLRHAGISIEDCSFALVAQEGKLVLTKNLPVYTKDGYCAICEKDVVWTCLMECHSGLENIESGHYYLEFGSGSSIWNSKIISGKVCLDLNGQTLTGRTRAFIVESGSVMNIMGEGTIIGRGMSSSLKIEEKTAGTILVEKKAVLNQYGGTLTYESVSGQNAGNGGILNVAGTYNLYNGEVKNGKSVWVGGNIFVTTGGTLNLYGGAISGGSASQLANSVAVRGKVTLSGNASANEIYLYPNTAEGGPALAEMLTVEGAYTGTVKFRVSGIKEGLDVGTAKNADFTGAKITTNSSAINGLAAHGKDLLLVGNKKIVHMEGTTVLGNYNSMEDAIAAYTGANEKLVLLADVENVQLDKDVYIDLNGHHITGTVSGNGTLYCMDAFTDDFTVADGVCGTVPASSQVQPVTKGAPCTTYGYVMVAENGKVSFHRIKLLVTAVNLRPAEAGLYYSCSFGGDEVVKSLVKQFGMLVSVAGDPLAMAEDAVIGTVLGADSFGADANVTSTMISGILKQENSEAENSANAEMAIYGRTYVELADGTVLYGNCVEKTLYEQVCGTEQQIGVERIWDGLSVLQKRSVMDLYETFAETMSGWDIPTIAGAVAVRDDAAEDILLARRAQVMAKMRAMGDIYWRATEDVKYHISDTARWVEFKAGRVYRGMPYAYARSDQNTFLEFAGEPDEKGIYDISGLTTTHLGNGGTYARIGNDCSGSVNFAWSSVGADISGTNSSRYMIEANGYYKVGIYDYTPTEDGRIGISKDMVKEIGKDVMFESYAKVLGGDGLVTTAAGGGHVILAMDKHVVYNTDGTINGEKSYIHTLEQTPGPVSITVQQHSWNEQLQEMVYDIYIEKNLTFEQCFSSGYLPITVKALTDASPVPEAGVTDSLSAEEYSYENLLKGSLTCTRMISSVNITVTDENGEVFSVTGSGIRASIRKYYMKNFLTEDPAVMRGTLELDKLIPGNSYHCVVKVQLASGDIITVRDFDFVATDADISVPEGSETIDPEEPEEEEIPEDPGVTPDGV